MGSAIGNCWNRCRSGAPAGTLNGSNAAFTLSFIPNPAASLLLFLNGVQQNPAVDYTISGPTVTYTD